MSEARPEACPERSRRGRAKATSARPVDTGPQPLKLAGFAQALRGFGYGPVFFAAAGGDFAQGQALREEGQEGMRHRGDGKQALFQGREAGFQAGGGEGVGAGLADGGQDFPVHPILEGLGFFFGAGEDQAVEAGFVHQPYFSILT